MTTEEKLDATIELVANIEANTRLLYSKVEGLHLALGQALILLDLPESNPRRAGHIAELKKLVQEALDQPTAKEAMQVPVKLLSALGWKD